MTPAVAILAGGLATRLRPITESVPKALVVVAGEPFAFHQLRLLARNGFKRVVFLIGYLGERIAEAVGDGSRFGLEVDYVSDGPVLLGTGGALARALPTLGERFAIIYGDSWLDFDYRAAVAQFERDARPALMTVFRNEGRWDTSNVELSGETVRAYSKTARTPQMTHIDYGFSLFSKAAFRDVPVDRPTDLAALFESLAARGLLAAHEVHQRFYEVGSFSGLADLEAHFSKAHSSEAHFSEENMMTYAEQHLQETIQIVQQLDAARIEQLALELADLRQRGGRLFFLGVGGSAANASHAVNDFRKIAGIEAYAPTDNVSELTARTNDEGWPTVFRAWLSVSHLSKNDAVFVLSVGGGNLAKNISPNIVSALELAKAEGARIFGIVGRDGGYTAEVGDTVVIIPTVNPDNVTPHSEAFQAVVWHLLVSHPALKAQQTKWESATR